MAMRIEELRVGNLVMYRNVLCKIFSIHSPQPMKNKRFSDKAYVDIWCNSIVSVLLSELESIPLTEEWLVEFGFVKIGKDLVFVGGFGNHNIRLTLMGESYVFLANSQWVHLFFVHQLQNLYFALTGEELYLKT